MKRMRRKLLAALSCLGLLLSASTFPTTAGADPWAWDYWFGPSCNGSSCGGCGLTSCGSCYAPSAYYQPPVYNSPVYSTQAYYAPAYAVSGGTYAVSGGTCAVSGSTCAVCPVGPTGCTPCGSQTMVTGGTYIDNSYAVGSYVQPGCSSCVVGCGTLNDPSSESTGNNSNVDPGVGTGPDSTHETFDSGLSTDTMDAEGSIDGEATDSVGGESAGNVGDDPMDPDSVIDGVDDEVFQPRRNRTDIDPSTEIGDDPGFEDPIDMPRGRNRNIIDDDPLFRESNKVVDPDSDVDSSDPEAGPGLDEDAVEVQDLDDDGAAKVRSTSPITVVGYEAQPLNSDIRIRLNADRPVRTMTVRSSARRADANATNDSPFVLNQSKRTPLRWISIPRTTRWR